jgi:2-polyprenyl-3-methyl-5-hydroxy-6-metoxy-1,4-benzoquinol methylase
MAQWYEELFKDYAETYDKESFTQGTVGEVDFIEKELGYDPSQKVLDIGCGTGRHAIELAKRGYSVTGIDLSESQITKAFEKAEKEKVSVDFQIKDARNTHYINEFDLAIMICEGGFSLMETDEMNFKILKNATHALKQKGKIIFTTLNALFPLYHSVKDFINQGINEGKTENNDFDLMTFREFSSFETTDDLGKKKILHCNERYYTPSEITRLLKTLNYHQIDIYGCELGHFSREKDLTTEDYEMLIVARI